MGAKIHGIISNGITGTLVDIECHLSNNLPTIVIVGFANKAVDEARERIRGAFATSRIMLPRKRITLNLAPADIPKSDSGFDLAMTVAILLADGQITREIARNQAFIGELGLDGGIRAVRGIIGKIMLARSKGISTFFIPYDNLPQALLIPDVRLIPLHNLGELYGHLCLGTELISHDTGKGTFKGDLPPARDLIGLSQVTGQEQAKRALEISAAGGHNLFFSGPPGTGKSMLAKAMRSILPPLTREELLEITHLHSLASNNYEQIVTERPFRAPHHSASHVAIVGGGARLRPGEISLAHRGVLFFDELPEFKHDTLEALRQPLEDRVVSLARARETAEFPADFIMIATANPCPCGYFGSNTDCRCSISMRMRYQNRVSGPIMDRIDLHCYVHKVEHDKLLAQKTESTKDMAVRSRIEIARQIQTDRFGGPVKLNADMNNDEVKRWCKLSPLSAKLLNHAADSRNLSARAYFRALKVARTIADLSESATIKTHHISEALAYRPQLRES